MPNSLAMPQLETNNLVPNLGDIEQQSLRNQLLKETIANQPAKRQLDEQALAIRSFALDLQSKLMSAKEEGGPFTFDYPDFSITSATKEGARKATELVAQYPDQVKDPGFMPFMAQLGVSIKAKEPSKYGPEAQAFELAKQKQTPQTPDAYVNPSGEVELVPKGQMPKPGSVPFKGKGLDIQFGEDGKPVRISQGEVGPVITKPTQTKLETKILDGKEQLSRMHSIALEFKPEYQEWGTRLDNAWTGVKASLGKNVDPEAAKAMTDFKKYQRKAIENINIYIKEITGAQMSESEANRIRLAMPDPGEKWWQGDDPITFKAKMDDVIKSTRAAVARYEYYKNKGISDKEVKSIIISGSAISLEDLISRME